MAVTTRSVLTLGAFPWYKVTASDCTSHEEINIRMYIAQENSL